MVDSEAPGIAHIGFQNSAVRLVPLLLQFDRVKAQKPPFLPAGRKYVGLRPSRPFKVKVGIIPRFKPFARRADSHIHIQADFHARVQAVFLNLLQLIFAQPLRVFEVVDFAAVLALKSLHFRRMRVFISLGPVFPERRCRILPRKIFGKRAERRKHFQILPFVVAVYVKAVACLFAFRRIFEFLKAPVQDVVHQRLRRRIVDIGAAAVDFQLFLKFRAVVIIPDALAVFELVDGRNVNINIVEKHTAVRPVRRSVFRLVVAGSVQRIDTHHPGAVFAENIPQMRQIAEVADTEVVLADLFVQLRRHAPGFLSFGNAQPVVAFLRRRNQPCLLHDFHAVLVNIRKLDIMIAEPDVKRKLKAVLAVCRPVDFAFVRAFVLPQPLQIADVDFPAVKLVRVFNNDFAAVIFLRVFVFVKIPFQHRRAVRQRNLYRRRFVLQQNRHMVHDVDKIGVLFFFYNLLNQPEVFFLLSGVRRMTIKIFVENIHSLEQTDFRIQRCRKLNAG